MIKFIRDLFTKPEYEYVGTTSIVFHLYDGGEKEVPFALYYKKYKNGKIKLIGKAKKREYEFDYNAFKFNDEIVPYFNKMDVYY